MGLVRIGNQLIEAEEVVNVIFDEAACSIGFRFRYDPIAVTWVNLGTNDKYNHVIKEMTDSWVEADWNK